MVLGVSPDLSTSLPMKYRTTTLDSGTLYLGSDHVLRLRELHPEGGAGHQRL